MNSTICTKRLGKAEWLMFEVSHDDEVKSWLPLNKTARQLLKSEHCQLGNKSFYCCDIIRFLGLGYQINTRDRAIQTLRI